MRTFPRNNPSWQMLQRRKCHLAPGLYRRLPTAISRKLNSDWAPVLKLLDMLSPLPDAVVLFWANHRRGHLLFIPSGCRYLPESMLWQDQKLQAVAEIGVQEIFTDEAQALSTVAELLDHLLGSGCEAGGKRLSDGAGLNRALEKMGAEVEELSSLGYGPKGTEHDPGAYFAWGMAAYLADQRSLNTQDPLLEKLLRHTIFSEEFWSAHPLMP